MILKFRVWDKLLKKWSKNSHKLLYGNDGTICFEKGDRYEFMQFTGLHDSHGREIYEGDIVSDGRLGVVGYFPEIASFLVLTTHGGQECLQGLGIGKPHLEETEVIGNIYENPELLEGGGE